MCCVVLYCILLYCVVLYCVALSCIVLYCIVLWCGVVWCGVRNRMFANTEISSTHISEILLFEWELEEKGGKSPNPGVSVGYLRWCKHCNTPINSYEWTSVFPNDLSQSTVFQSYSKNTIYSLLLNPCLGNGFAAYRRINGFGNFIWNNKISGRVK